ARQLFDEDTLRKLKLGRLAVSFIAGLVALYQSHGDFGAGPGMLREVTRGLCRAAAGARLRQCELEFGRVVKWVRRLCAVNVVTLEREFGMRLDHAVVVFHPVVEPQRAAGLPFRILDQFDG